MGAAPPLMLLSSLTPPFGEALIRQLAPPSLAPRRRPSPDRLFASGGCAHSGVPGGHPGEGGSHKIGSPRTLLPAPSPKGRYSAATRNLYSPVCARELES